MWCFDPFLFAAVIPAIRPAMCKVLTESDELRLSLQLLFDWSPEGSELQLTTRENGIRRLGLNVRRLHSIIYFKQKKWRNFLIPLFDKFCSKIQSFAIIPFFISSWEYYCWVIEAVLLGGRYAGIGLALTCHQLLNVLYGMKWTPCIRNIIIHTTCSSHQQARPGHGTDTV